MYGTVAHMTLKPGMESALRRQLTEFHGLNVPGFLDEHLYRMDAEPDVYYLAVLFDSRESYRANAESPEQDVRYREMRALLDSDPEWHDGEIVSAD